MTSRSRVVRRAHRLARLLSLAALSFIAGCQSSFLRRTSSYDPALGAFGAYDVYTPIAVSDQPRPAVIAIHGGSWRTGDKSWGEGVAEELCPEGYTVLAINYRLAPKSRWPTQIEDVQRALRHFRASAAELHIDPARIAAFGVSAGAHLAGMLLLRGPDRVSVAIAASGPTDMTLLDVADPSLTALLGPDPSPEQLRDASPVAFARPDASLLLLHAKRDPRVSARHCEVMLEAMRRAGADVQGELIDGATHGRAWKRRVAEILEFLEDRL